MAYGLWSRPRLTFCSVSGLRVSITMGKDTRPHRSDERERERPLGLWSRPQRGQGEGKKAEEQTPWRLLGL